MKRTIIAALALVAMAGCTKDETGTADNLAASFTSSIEQTRVSGTSWESGDQVGIMITTDNIALDDYRYNNCHDVTFSDPTQGIFVPASDLDQIYYSLDEDDYIDFYAYYPYESSLTASSESYPINVTNQQVPRNIDFMEASTRSDGSGGYNKNSGTVPFTFTRNMAKISLKLVAGDGLDLSDISEVKLSGFYTWATYYFPTNSFNSFSGNTTAITPYYAGSNTYSAILIPENATSHMIYFTTPYGTVPLSLSSYKLSKGEHLYFTVTVSRTEATYLKNEINGWDEAEIATEDATLETE